MSREYINGNGEDFNPTVVFHELRRLADDFVVPLSNEDRLTHYHGDKQESVTDHTVMLSLIACALAARFRPDLDIGLVSQFALVHDLVEAKSKDTPTLKITDQEVADMELREQQALVEINEAWTDSFPWLTETIAAYERLDTKEARFIKALDKLMPGVTIFMNSGKVFKKNGFIMEDFELWVSRNRDTLTSWDPFIGQLVDAFVDELRRHPEYFYQPED